MANGRDMYVGNIKVWQLGILLAFVSSKRALVGPDQLINNPTYKITAKAHWSYL